MQVSTKKVRDKWRSKAWYTVVAPPYFGNVELGAIPADEQEKLVGRVVEATLYEITGDFAHQYLKIYFQITSVEGKTARTMFKGHEYSRDYLRSLVRRRTTKVDGIFNVTTKDGYRLRVAVCAFTLSRIKTSQEQAIRKIMTKIVEEKSKALTMDQFVQEMVLGKIASDIYNEAKKIVPLRHVGIRKSKLLTQAAQLQAPLQTVEQQG
ncbi:MAG: 30S ribosomal protein S3ae [Candidatus Bathyarchaeota archaeon]|nr:30S ribosomal protein S3ae [Candidatus Bathyarchaeota archaeon A05DMB-3]MDH7607261.1 30S ribosomal protein S3ae [Candidatus Bathyarchaeota archaeon]